MNAALPEIFVSYSHKDEKWLKLLRTHLAPLETRAQVRCWDDKRIDPGGKWKDEIKDALARARVGLLLVTPHYLASPYIAEHELPPLLSGTTVFWIAVSASMYKFTEIAEYEAANDPEQPLDSLRGSDRNKVIVGALMKLLKMVSSHQPPPRSAGTSPGDVVEVPAGDRPLYSPTADAVSVLPHAERIERRLGRGRDATAGVNVVLIDDNRDNLRHMVEFLKPVTEVAYGDDVITSIFHPFRPKNSRDDPTRIDIEGALKKVEALKPGVAIIDQSIEGDGSDDYSGSRSLSEAQVGLQRLLYHTRLRSLRRSSKAAGPLGGVPLPDRSNPG